MGVERLDGAGGPQAYPLQPNSEYRVPNRGSKTMGDNIRGQKGNNPDHQLRSLNTSEF